MFAMSLTGEEQGVEEVITVHLGSRIDYFREWKRVYFAVDGTL